MRAFAQLKSEGLTTSDSEARASIAQGAREVVDFSSQADRRGRGLCASRWPASRCRSPKAMGQRQRRRAMAPCCVALCTAPTATMRKCGGGDDGGPGLFSPAPYSLVTRPPLWPASIRAASKFIFTSTARAKQPDFSSPAGHFPPGPRWRKWRSGSNLAPAHAPRPGQLAFG